MPNFLSAFNNLLTQSTSIILTTHISPDEDAIASILSLYHFIKQNYPDNSAKMIITGQSIDRYQSFPHFNQINFTSDLSKHLTGCDLLICLDGGQYNRFTNRPQKLADFKHPTVCIDHHPNPPDRFTLKLIDPKASSATELIYQAFFKDKKLSPSIAQTLLMGILGDTGNFSYLSPNQSQVFSIAKKLLQASQLPDIQTLQSRYQTLPMPIFKLVQKLIKNTQFHHLKNWPQFQTSLLPQQTLNQYSDNQISQAGKFYLANFTRHIENYPWGFVLTPRSDNQVHISLRSLPSGVNVRRIVATLNVGGGHDLAAGGSFPIDSNHNHPIKTRLQDILTWLKNNSAS